MITRLCLSLYKLLILIIQRSHIVTNDSYLHGPLLHIVLQVDGLESLDVLLLFCLMDTSRLSHNTQHANLQFVCRIPCRSPLNVNLEGNVKIYTGCNCVILTKQLVISVSMFDYQYTQ